jgi:transcriptional regulator with XRE-family HTH domain
MFSSDLIYIARRRAGITQAELGRRLGLPQSQISRWERGAVEPSLETLTRLVRACGLELTLGIANGDDSYDAFINRALDRTPAERVSDAVQWAKGLARLQPPLEAARG